MGVPFQIGELPTEERKLRKLSRVHLDIGFGDRLMTAPHRVELSSTLEIHPNLSWQVYPLESVFAEKLETLVSRGSANSRAKDLYDLVMIGGRLRSIERLGEAIKTTFETRRTSFPDSFEKFFKQLDLTILKKSWEVVQFSDGNIRFEHVREQLVNLLKLLDQILFRDVES